MRPTTSFLGACPAVRPAPRSQQHRWLGSIGPHQEGLWGGGQDRLLQASAPGAAGQELRPGTERAWTRLACGLRACGQKPPACVLRCRWPSTGSQFSTPDVVFQEPRLRLSECLLSPRHSCFPQLGPRRGAPLSAS